MGQPPIDLSPTFQHIVDIKPQADEQLKYANRHAAFLLGITGLLRPSDLHYIQLQQCTIDTSNRLTLVISQPKERRGGHSIIKCITIHLHTTNISLCPIHAFKVLRDHTQAQQHWPADILFIDSHHPRLAVQVQTISKWLINMV